MKKILFTLCLLYAGFTNALGTQHVSPLKIGDKLPDLQMAKVMVNGKLQNMNTADFKDKLLILDFWDTFCGACIEAMPRMDALQKAYGDQLEIVTISWQKEDVLRTFKEKNKIGQSVNLPLMVEDSLLKSYFPHRLVSHTVWVNKGVVVAISNSEYVSKQIIDKALSGEKLNLPLKNDFATYDFKNNSILGNATSNDKKIYSALTGYKEGVTVNGPALSTVKDSVNGTVKDVFLNYEIARLYITLLNKIKFIPYKLKSSMVIVESSHPEKYDLIYMGKDEFSEDWIRQHAVCYESVLPATLDDKERAKLMIADLDNKLGLKGRMEPRPKKVWVIKPLKGAKLVSGESKNEKSQGKQDFEQFMIQLRVDLMLRPEFVDFLPIIDESDRKPEQSMDLYAFSNHDGFKRMLNLNGLDLIEEIRPFEVFVLTETRK